jgi:hypothetical protein
MGHMFSHIIEQVLTIQCMTTGAPTRMLILTPDKPEQNITTRITITIPTIITISTTIHITTTLTIHNLVELTITIGNNFR